MTLIAEMTDEQVRSLLERVEAPADPDAKRRRDDLHARWLALRERHLESIQERIGQTYRDPEVISEVSTHAREIWNPLRRVVNRVAKAYQVRPRRKLTKGPKKAGKELAQLLRDIGFNGYAKKANRLQVAMNCVVALVLPREREDGTPTIGIDLVTGAHAEVVQHPKAPYGETPSVLAYSLLERGDDRRAGTEAPEQAVFAMVDRERWRFYNRQRQPVGEDVEHGLGRFPGVPLRLEPADDETDNGWWGADVGRGLSQVVADVGMVAATMNWTRKIQCRNLVAILSGSDDAAEGDGGDGDQGQHLAHPEEMMHLQGDNLDLRVVSLVTPIKEFREHIEYMTGEVAEVLTGSSSTLTDPQPGLAQADTTAVQQHAALRELQDSQIENLEPWERRLIPLVCRMAKWVGMPNVPDPDLVEKALDVYFPRLPFLDTPGSRLDYHIKATAFGVGDQVDFVMEHESVDEETAYEIVIKKAERRARLHKLLATHNQPRDPTEEPNAEPRPEMIGERPEAQTGRYGGRARPTEQNLVVDEEERERYR